MDLLIRQIRYRERTRSLEITIPRGVGWIKEKALREAREARVSRNNYPTWCGMDGFVMFTYKTKVFASRNNYPTWCGMDSLIWLCKKRLYHLYNFIVAPIYRMKQKKFANIALFSKCNCILLTTTCQRTPIFRTLSPLKSSQII